MVSHQRATDIFFSNLRGQKTTKDLISILMRLYYIARGTQDTKRNLKKAAKDK